MTDEYFSNIMARSYADNAAKVKLELDHAKDIYVIMHAQEKSYLLGQSEKGLYFILTYHQNPGYNYSVVIMHHDAVKLLNSFKEKELFLQGNSAERFVNFMLLNHKLTEQLK